MSSALIIVNPRSGSAAGQADALAGLLAERLAAQRIEACTIPFDTGRRRGGAWRPLLDAGLASGAGRVYVLGGDGTVLAVAAALIGREVPLGILPLGTANLLARDLAIPLEPAAAVAGLIQVRVRRIDVGRVNGEPFLCASMLGLSTALARAREAARGVGRARLWTRLLRKALRLLGRYPYRRLELLLDDDSSTLCTRALIVTNNPLTPSPGLYPRRERLDGGRLGIYGVHQGPLWELPRLALRLVNGDWPEDPRIFRRDAARVVLRSRPHRHVTLMNDGERRRLSLPLRYDQLPAALPVLVPEADVQGCP